MGFFAPLALLALPLLGVIVALYLLRLRRPIAPVASTHLWDTLTRDREANTLWQRLRVSILLILQFTALLTLILALARPWVPSAERLGQNAIIVLDVSASMGAIDARNDPRTRMEMAKDAARDIVDDLPQGGTVTLIASDERASIVVPATDDKARVRRAIGDLEVQPAGTNMVNAMQLAGAMAARQRNSVVRVISDGAFQSTATQVEPIPAAIRFIPVGGGEPNHGITALTLEPGAGSLSLFVQVASSADTTVTQRLDFLIDEAPWSARTVTIGPGATQGMIVENVPLGSRVIQVELAEPDALAIDNRAWVINRASVPATVLLVSGGNRFLEVALSLLPTVVLYRIAPADYDPAAKISGAAPDLTIFDADVPSATLQTLPAGNLLLVAPQASTNLLEIRGVITNPVPTAGSSITSNSGGIEPNPDGDGQDPVGRVPLLRFVDLSSLHIAESVAMDLPTWGRTVLDSDKGPLLIAGERNGQKIVALGFDLRDSDLPVQTAFPLLIRNLVTYLLPEPAGGLPAAVAPGSSVGIEAVSASVDRVLVEDPAGKEWIYSLDGSTRRIAFAETQTPGVYYVTQYRGQEIVAQEAVAVNLFARNETTTVPNRTPGLPQAAPVTPIVQGGQVTDEETFRREIWPIVALVGFIFLLVEWLYAQRIALRRALLELRARRTLTRVERT